MNKNSKKLFVSNIFKIISTSFMSVFIASFIWWATKSFIAVAIYFLSYFLFLPLMFYINGILLRKYNIRNLFFFGALCSGFADIAIILFSNIDGHLFFAVAGMIRGIGHGLYWPNRNYLEFQELKDGIRDYFYSTMQAIAWVVSTIIPLIVGCFIAFGSYSELYSTKNAYWIIFGFSFFMMLFVAKVIITGKFKSPAPLQIQRFTIQKFFTERRILGVARGITEGTSFIIPLVVLIFIGNEGALGTLTAIASICAAGLIYIYGCFSNKKYRYSGITLSTIIYFLSALGLILLPMPFGAIAFALFSGIMMGTLDTIMEPILLFDSDKEMGIKKKMRYSFIFDNEAFLNLGRVTGIILVMAIALITSQTNAIIYGPLILGGLQLMIILGVQILKRL